VILNRTDCLDSSVMNDLQVTLLRGTSKMQKNVTTRLSLVFLRINMFSYALPVYNKSQIILTIVVYKEGNSLSRKKIFLMYQFGILDFATVHKFFKYFNNSLKLSPIYRENNLQ
jgi:hypothetical protein